MRKCVQVRANIRTCRQVRATSITASCEVRENCTACGIHLKYFGIRLLDAMLYAKTVYVLEITGFNKL
jgi:hypothetical protein